MAQNLSANAQVQGAFGEVPIGFPKIGVIQKSTKVAMKAGKAPAAYERARNDPDNIGVPGLGATAVSDTVVAQLNELIIDICNDNFANPNVQMEEERIQNNEQTVNFYAKKLIAFVGDMNITLEQKLSAGLALVYGNDKINPDKTHLLIGFNSAKAYCLMVEAKLEGTTLKPKVTGFKTGYMDLKTDQMRTVGDIREKLMEDANDIAKASFIGKKKYIGYLQNSIKSVYKRVKQAYNRLLAFDKVSFQTIGAVKITLNILKDLLKGNMLYKLSKKKITYNLEKYADKANAELTGRGVELRGFIKANTRANEPKQKIGEGKIAKIEAAFNSRLKRNFDRYTKQLTSKVGGGKESYVQ